MSTIGWLWERMENVLADITTAICLSWQLKLRCLLNYKKNKQKQKHRTDEECHFPPFAGTNESSVAFKPTGSSSCFVLIGVVFVFPEKRGKEDAAVTSTVNWEQQNKNAISLWTNGGVISEHWSACCGNTLIALFSASLSKTQKAKCTDGL